MKSKILKMMGVLLVVSLLLMAIPATVMAGDPDLSISVTPPSGTNIFCDDSTTLTATVSNAGDYAEDVVITAEVASGDATLSGPISTGVLLYDICSGSSKQATGTLTCTGPTDATVQFTATPTNGDPVVTTVTYNQVCRLGVEITSPADGTSVNISDTFAVTAEVTNNTSEECTGVTVTLGITGGNASLVGGSDIYTIDLPAGDTEVLNWTVHCDDEGDAELTVSASGCGQSGACETACTDTITIHQPAPETCGLDLVITSAPVGEICVGTSFVVSGYVENTGNQTLTGVDTRLIATTFTGSVSIVPSGWNLVASSLAPGATAPVSWTVTCTGREQTGQNEECLDELIDFDADARATCVSPDDTTDSEDLDDYANQKFVIVTLLPPTVTCNDFCVNDEWLVDVEVHNCLEGNAEGNISITVGGNATLVTPPVSPQTMSIPAGGTVRLSDEGGPLPFHVKCINPGDVDITVKYLGVVGTTTICDEDTATIHQKTPADLNVVVNAPDCEQYCDEFDVTATVTNPGGANAAPVSNVNITMTASGDVEPVGSMSGPTGDTDQDGLLDQDETWTYTWTYHCNGWDDASFRVDVTGTDAVCDAILSDYDTDGTEQVKLDIDIVSPEECSTFGVCDTFCVTAKITDNDGDTCFSSLAAVISFPNGKAALVANETASKSFVLTQGDTQQISWTVHCDEPGDTDIKVEVTGYAGNPEGCNQCTLTDKTDTITVHQVETKLAVEILSPRGLDAELQSSDNATAQWSTDRAYTGNYSAKLNAISNDWAAVVLTPPPGITLDDMATITSGWSWWYYIATADFGVRGTQLELRFRGPGDGYAEMTIMDKAYGTPAHGGPPTLDAWTEQTIVSDTTTGIVFGTKEDGTPIAQYPPGNEGTIADLVAYMKTQDANAGAWVLTEVRPSLGWIGAAETTAYVDTVTIAGTTYDLEPFSTYVATSQDFAVTARVTNVGVSAVTNVPVTINPGANASVMSPAATQYADIPVGGSVVLTWTLHCDAQGMDTITVSAVGDTTVAAIVNVEQYPAAHLEVDITSVTPSTTINVCDEFVVNYTVTNTGEADAWEVSAVLSVSPEGSARPVEGMDSSYTQYIGTLAGHGQDGTYSGSFTMHCKQACESTITITAEGFDEYGYHFKQVYLYDTWVDPICHWVGPDGEGSWECIDGYWLEGEGWVLCLEPESGRAIDERFIEPASVTVKQLESEADLAVTKTVDAIEPVEIGTEVTFTITVTNLGPSDATTIWVWDMLPAGLNFVSCSADQGYYFVSSGYWNVGDLAEDAIATLDIVATVNTVGEIENLAAIDFADQHDPITGNNAATAMVEGLEPEAVDQATITVSPGWNLISLPIIPGETEPHDIPIDVMTAALGAELDMIYGYDPEGAPPLDFPWYNPDLPLGGSPLQVMVDGSGYWVRMNDPGAGGSFTFPGWEHVAETDPPSLPPSYAVVEGWNLAGFKSTTPELAAEYLAGIAGSYVIIYGYEGGSFFIVGTPGHEFLQPGLGYWIAVIAPGIIYP